MTPHTCDQVRDVQTNCILDGGDPWFTSSGAAAALKRRSSDEAVRRHAGNDDKRQQGCFNLDCTSQG